VFYRGLFLYRNRFFVETPTPSSWNEGPPVSAALFSGGGAVILRFRLKSAHAGADIDRKPEMMISCNPAPFGA
jgi:hypothetical protein